MLQSLVRKFRLRRLLVDERGATSAEYALILCVVGVGIGAAMLVLGNNVGSSMNGSVGDFDPAYAGSTKSGAGNPANADKDATKGNPGKSGDHGKPN